jgi:hypothetical protein
MSTMERAYNRHDSPLASRPQSVAFRQIATPLRLNGDSS